MRMCIGGRALTPVHITQTGVSKNNEGTSTNNVGYVHVQITLFAKGAFNIVQNLPGAPHAEPVCRTQL